MTEKESWHLDKRIPIVIILGLLANFATVIWFASKLDSRIEIIERYIEHHIEEHKDINQDRAEWAELKIHMQYLMLDIKEIKEFLKNDVDWVIEDKK